MATTATAPRKPPRRIQGENRVAVTVDADIDEVWEVIRDVTRVGEWSHECVGAAWLGASNLAVPGARFRGRNRAGVIRWGRTCEIVRAEPYELTWVTIPTARYPDSSEWRITLDKVDGGTRITQNFHVLRAPTMLSVLYALLIPGHRDRTSALIEDLQRLGTVAHRPGVALEATALALRAAARRTSTLLRTVTDPATPVPGLAWTVAETAAHLVEAARGYAGFITGDRDAHADLALAPDAASPGELGAIMSARLLENVSEADLSRLADEVIAEVDRLIASFERRTPDELIPTWVGVPMTIPTIAAALLGEQVIHGLDIARAVGAPWPISQDDALLVLAGTTAVAPSYVDRQRAAGLHIDYELRLRGGPRYRFTIEDGTAAVGPPGGKVDCWISADPVAFLLVTYGRTGQWGPTMRGKIIAGGRKPWLGLKFRQLLTSI